LKIFDFPTPRLKFQISIIGVIVKGSNPSFPPFTLRVRDRSLRARGSSEPEAGSETKGRNSPLWKRGVRGDFRKNMFSQLWTP